MPIDKQILLNMAVKAAERAYAPYSGWHVGAVAQFIDFNTNTDGFMTGTNVENCSYGLTICAERSAICKGVSEGYKFLKAVAIAVLDKDQQPVKTFHPCGACLQFMAEFGRPDTLILLNGMGEYTLRQLLPYQCKI